MAVVAIISFERHHLNHEVIIALSQDDKAQIFLKQVH